MKTKSVTYIAAFTAAVTIMLITVTAAVFVAWHLPEIKHDTAPSPPTSEAKKVTPNRDQPTVIVVQAGGPRPTGDVLNDLLLDHRSACLNGPIAQFGRYVGDWDIAEETISQDGKTWTPGTGARWKFVCIGGGKAVQDYWIPNQPNGDAYLSGFGSNFRVYDPGNNTWDTVWAGPGGPSFTHISGKQDAKGNIVMYWLSPVQDPPRRITFFPPVGDEWNWLLELSYDKGQAWQPVYKIKATKRQ